MLSSKKLIGSAFIVSLSLLTKYSPLMGASVSTTATNIQLDESTQFDINEITEWLASEDDKCSFDQENHLAEVNSIKSQLIKIVQSHEAILGAIGQGLIDSIIGLTDGIKARDVGLIFESAKRIFELVLEVSQQPTQVSIKELIFDIKDLVKGVVTKDYKLAAGALLDIIIIVAKNS